MNLRTRLALTALAGVLLAGTASTNAWGAVDETGTTARPADSLATKPPTVPNDRYLYSATFDAVVKHSLRNDYGSYDAETREMTTRITGTLPPLMTDGRELITLTARGHRSSVRTSESKADTTQATDDGRFVQTCAGSTAIANGRPFVTEGLAGTQFTLFAGLEFPTRCTDNQGSGVTEGRYFLGPLVADRAYKGDRGENGDRTIVLPISGDSAESVGTADDPARCPGYVAGETQSCSYTVAGTITLKRIKKVGPSKPAKGSKGASVTPRKAEVKVQCPAKCTIEIELLPLRGGPTLTVERVSPTPGRTTEVTVPIPTKKRKAVVQSGGVQIKLTYTLASGLSFSESRTAVL